MKELGTQSDKIHKNIGKLLSTNIDLFVAVGEEMKTAQKEFNRLTKSENKSLWFANSKDVLDNLQNLITANDLILVKGSQSSRMERISAELLLNKKFSKELLPRQSQEWLSRD